MKRFHEVAPGILRGGLPTPKEVRVLHDIWQVKRIISLDLEGGESISPVCQKLNIEHLMIPIELNESSNDIKETIQFLSDNIVDLLTQRQPVYIHCIYGRDRTGLAIALYRMKGDGWSKEKALKEAKSFQFGEGLSTDQLNLFLSFFDDSDNALSNDRSYRKRRIRKQYLADINESMAQVGATDTSGSTLNYVNPIGSGFAGIGNPIPAILPYINSYL